MKLTTLNKIARHIETVLGCAPARMTVREMWNRLVTVAGDCRTKKDAAQTIAEEIFGHTFGEYPSTDSEILSVR